MAYQLRGAKEKLYSLNNEQNRIYVLSICTCWNRIVSWIWMQQTVVADNVRDWVSERLFAWVAVEWECVETAKHVKHIHAYCSSSSRRRVKALRCARVEISYGLNAVEYAPRAHRSINICNLSPFSSIFKSLNSYCVWYVYFVKFFARWMFVLPLNI